VISPQKERAVSRRDVEVECAAELLGHEWLKTSAHGPAGQ
jgi:hypothetical protein